MTFPNKASASATTKRFTRSVITDRQPSAPLALRDKAQNFPHPQARQRPSLAPYTRHIGRSSRTPARATRHLQKGRPYAPPPPPRQGQVPDRPLPSGRSPQG